MSSEIKDGGPAFPCVEISKNNITGETTTNQWTHPGVTLRDYFAAKALPSVIQAYSSKQAEGDELAVESAICDGFGAKASVEYVDSDGIGRPMTYAEAYAQDAYALANAMLAAREAKL